jgi:hypothetical protein
MLIFVDIFVYIFSYDEDTNAVRILTKLHKIFTKFCHFQ